MAGMSAGAAVRAGVLAALRAVPGLAVTRVVEGGARATAPYALLRDVSATDWGTKDRAGREVRVGVTVRDVADAPAHAEALAAAAEAALLALPRVLEGWAVASVVPVRCVTLSEGERGWAVLVDVRVRVLAG